MKIAIIGGTGKLGRSLAFRAEGTHEVVIGSRKSDKADEAARSIGGSVVGLTNEAAASWCDLAVLTLPYHAHHDVLERLRSSFSGKIVIDTTVPIDPDNLSQTRTKSNLSAAEEAAELLANDIAVFAAFQTVSFHTLSDREAEIDVLVAGPHSHFNVVAELISSIRLRPIACGPISNARYLEQLTLLLMSVNREYRCKSSSVRILGIPESR